ncbi:MauE/DoxX family redox-associated membrane protein [Paenibacillus methanolicus]|uniref:Methylamine utilisation protein MauE domain-containing protein n=1 Tax=Paenibacillus methanolicus TaxID=582686 RepID=A0A5S5C3Z6_9BACL|nr:MauE/DoxX family redox-associated membrane protein [Paenibacillus methanolicus]TYP73146.1 hypothetical protein BCM02_107130 [Paenibacillus methanolicus]
MHIAAYMLDMVMAALFFLAAFSKLGSSFADFRLSIVSYRVLPIRLVTLAASGVLAAEFALFLLYGFGLLFIWKDLFALLLFAFFTAMLFRKRRLKENADSSCSCFGRIQALNRYPVLRNGLLMALTSVRLLLPERIPHTMDSAMHALAGVTVIASGVMLAQLYASLARSKEVRIEL